MIPFHYTRAGFMMGAEGGLYLDSAMIVHLRRAPDPPGETGELFDTVINYS